MRFDVVRPRWTAVYGDQRGALLKFNLPVSFHAKCGTKEEVDAIWEKLSPGGKTFMPLDSYPVSDRYGSEDRRVTHAFLMMKKFDITALKRAAAGSIYFAFVTVGIGCAKFTRPAVQFYA